MMPDLDRIYRAIPTVECKGLCAEACGPIQMSPQEHQRIMDRGVDIPDGFDLLANGKSVCPALKDNRCTVYEDRPLICRLWGAVESMPCPFGCTSTPGLLMDAGARALLDRVRNADA